MVSTSLWEDTVTRLAGLFDAPTTIDLDWDAPIQSMDLSRLPFRIDALHAAFAGGLPVAAVVAELHRRYIALAEAAG